LSCPFVEAYLIAQLFFAEEFARGSASKSSTTLLCPFLDAHLIAQLLLVEGRIATRGSVNKRATAQDNKAIELASEKGYDKVVAVLLTDSRVAMRPSVYNHVIKHASVYGFYRVVTLLKTYSVP